jgi:hypothetical protein
MDGRSGSVHGGTSAPTCSNWTATGRNQTAGENSHARPTSFDSGNQQACNAPLASGCLEP